MIRLILQLLIQTVIQSSLLALVVLIVRRLFKSRLDKRYLSLLWLPVLLRFFFPFGIESSFSLMNLFSRITEDRFINSPVYISSQEKTAVAAAATDALQLSTVLFAVWILGVALTAFVTIFNNIRFMSKIRSCRKEVDPGLFNDLCREAGIKRTPKIYCSYKIQSPCAAGIFRQAIYMPDWEEGGEEIRYIFMHELAHIKRRDNLFAVIVSVACILYWFDPLVWIMAHISRQDRELGCDAQVMKGLSYDERQDYGMTLISVLRRQNVSSRLTCVSGMASTKKEMHERLKAIKNSRPASALVAVMIIVAMVIASVTLGTSAKTVKAAKTDAGDLKSEVLPAEKVLAYVSSSEFDKEEDYFGTVRLNDEMAIDRLYDCLMSGDGWTGDDKVVLGSNDPIEAYYFITVPEDNGVKEKGKVFQVYDFGTRCYVIDQDLPYSSSGIMCHRMSDECYEEFRMLMKEAAD